MRGRSLSILVGLPLLVACGATPEPLPAADGAPILIVNARLLEHPGADAVLVRGSHVAAVGPAAQLSEQAGEGAQRLDARGGLVLPGFHDAHVHLLGGALAARQLDLSECATLEQVRTALREWAAAHPDDEWLIGRGWSYDLVPEGSFPLAADLDAAVPGRPVMLESYDGHSMWGNSEALQRAGIGKDTPDLAAGEGRIVRAADGSPAGVLLEGASQLLERAVPALSRADRRAALHQALVELRAMGITSATAMQVTEDEWDLLADLEATGQLPLRITAWLPWQTDLDRVVRLRSEHAQGRLRVGGLKGFLDGVIESRTAYLLADYVGHPGERGEPAIPPEALFARVGEAAERGVPVALHAIGDGAIRLALDAIAARGRGLRHRLEHLEIVDPADLPRFKDLGVLASMQPHHAIPSADPDTGSWSEGLGADRLTHTFPWRALLDAGARLAFGSDWPVMSADPLRGLAVAVTRRNEQGQPAGGWNAHQAITLREAVRAYGEGSAWGIGREQELGRIAPGYLADLVVIDPSVDPEAPRTLWSGKVAAVLLDGEVVHEGHGR